MIQALNRFGRVSIFVGVAFAFSSQGADAANWYVRPSGGSGAGTSWSAAWNGFRSIQWGAVACGDTIWVAGGTYTDTLAPQKKCTSSSRLFIRRARSDASEVTTAAGWSSAFDSIVHQQAGIVFGTGDYDYITVSGKTTASGGTNGWWIDLSGMTSGSGISIRGSADFDTVEYMDLQGPGYINYTSDGRGIDAVGTMQGHTFSHLRIWNWESGFYHVGLSNSLIEYLDMSGIGAVNAGTYHPNGIITWSSTNVVVRYSKFHLGANGFGIGEGIFFEQTGGNSNWQIYGNVFYNLSQGKVIQITSSAPNVKIFNNTFFNNSWRDIQVRTDQGGACATGSETRNNLFFSSTGADTCGTMSNNIVSSSPNPFVNSGGGDFHIVGNVGTNYPRDAGVNLSTYFTTDLDGTSFGADGMWDVGAFSFGSTSQGSTPPSPSNLRLVQ